MCIWAAKRKMYKQYKEENLLLTWLNVSKKKIKKNYSCALSVLFLKVLIHTH